MQPNFFVVFPSGLLEEAPANHILAAKAQGIETIIALQGEVVKTFPNVSAINLSMVLESLKEIFDKVGFVVRFMASFTILTGIVALIATVLTSRYQRMKENVLLRSLGANTAQVRKIMAVEYFLVGGLGSAAGVLLSLGGASGRDHRGLTPSAHPWCPGTPCSASCRLVLGRTKHRSSSSAGASVA